MWNINYKYEAMKDILIEIDILYENNENFGFLFEAVWLTLFIYLYFFFQFR